MKKKLNKKKTNLTFNKDALLVISGFNGQSINPPIKLKKGESVNFRWNDNTNKFGYKIIKINYNNNMKKISIRHGDIGFIPTDKIEGELVEHKGSFVVGFGETTGHRHVLTVKKPQDLIIKKDLKGDYYFELLSDGELTHEEHKTIKMPAGTYKKFQEEEVDWFAKGVTRKVID